ncbi:Uncharacterized protein TCM_023043 [Theobroma cacao]|uniref:TF-B3 domain-containing protein n=1 Tax=Theobroma cacao TaxID=3641 RepID=A0A061EUM3_THECC|nr:Uncharacterized protein TCM_023043 [Theobroma cacao]
MKIFSKTLCATDINRRCAVGMNYFKMERFPKLQGHYKVDFVVKDESGRKWIFCCSTRITKNPNHPKHPKPVLIKEWIPFVRSKKLCVGDRVTIYAELDEIGSTNYRVKVDKRTSPSKAASSHVMNHNPDGDNSSSSHNSDNESKATFQPSRDLLPEVLNRDLGGTTAATGSSFDKEQLPTNHSIFQVIKCYKTERSLSLELTLKPTMTRGSTAATSSCIYTEQTPNPHSTSRDIKCDKITRPSLNLSLELALTPTMTGRPHHAYMQWTEPKTMNFFGS